MHWHLIFLSILSAGVGGTDFKEMEIDRVYLSTPTKIAVTDHEKKRTLELRKEGFPDADLFKHERRKLSTEKSIFKRKLSKFAIKIERQEYGTHRAKNRSTCRLWR